MAFSKCRKSLFCILFLFFFSLGTICGVLSFRYLAELCSGWMYLYCGSLHPLRNGLFLPFVFSWLRPLLLAFLMRMVPWGKRVLPVLIFSRGFLTAYSAAACFSCGQPPVWVIVRGMTLLPLFYALCRFAFFAFPVPGGREI